MSNEQDYEQDYERADLRIAFPAKKPSFYFKFISRGMIYDDICEAKVINLSRSGAQVCTDLPNLKLLKLLGQEKLYIGCNILVEGDAKPIKAIARIRWAASHFKDGEKCHRIGLHFKKIPKSDRDRLAKFLIHQQIMLSKANVKVNPLP